MSDPNSFLAELVNATTTLLWLLADVLGIVLALANLSKARTAAILLLVGSLLRLASYGAQQFLFRFIAPDADLDPQTVGLISQGLSLPGLMGSVMIVLAVIAGRTKP